MIALLVALPAATLLLKTTLPTSSSVWTVLGTVISGASLVPKMFTANVPIVPLTLATLRRSMYKIPAANSLCAVVVV